MRKEIISTTQLSVSLHFEKYISIIDDDHTVYSTTRNYLTEKKS